MKRMLLIFLAEDDVILQMNFLAHAVLSFNNPDILTGNMISDFVKGKTKFNYPLSIQKGILLHREIDNFTDFHPVTAKAKGFFRPQYRLYSGAFIDIVYDHFLALDKQEFEENNSLENFTKTTFNFLDEKASYFPLPFQKMFPYMKSQNWLYEYRLKEGIRKSFTGLVRRAAYLDESEIAFEIFNLQYKKFENFYQEFFPELKEFAFRKMQQIIS